MPEAYLKAVEALSRENPSMRAALGGMRFAGFEDGVVTVRFARAQLMFMKMLERKQALLDEAFSQAFSQSVRVNLCLEGAAAPAQSAAQARRVIEQSYDVFGRENIDLTD